MKLFISFMFLEIHKAKVQINLGISFVSDFKIA